MFDKILNVHNLKKLIGIYTDSINLDSFSVGYVLHVDKNSYILYEVSPYGQFDGYSCRLIEDIVKIEEDSKYLDNMQKLVNYYDLDMSDIIFDDSKPIIFSFLEYIKSSKKVCSIQSCNSEVFDIVGFIKKYNKNSIEILQIDENASEDGYVTISLDDIEKIICCSNDEVKLEILYKLNKNN